MHRIDHPTAAGVLPAPEAAGTPGFFTDGNPATGTAATVVDRDWMNSVQEEIANVIDAAGIPLLKTDRTQLLAAVTALVNGGVTSSAKPRGHLAGLGLANAADAEHDITVAVGSARGANDNYDMVLAAALTKRIDAAWAAGDDAGGLFSGTVAADTWYHVFLIRKDSDGSIDAGFDTDIGAANIPAGYAGYRRLGSVLTDGSANNLPFVQWGDRFLWKTVIDDYSGTDTTTAALRTLSTPPGVRCLAHLNLRAHVAAENFATYLSSPESTDEAIALATTPYGTMAAGNTPNTGAITATTNTAQADVLTDTSSRIRSRSYAVHTIGLGCLGYTDRRGRDD
jgi:hypothetical protein